MENVTSVGTSGNVRVRVKGFVIEEKQIDSDVLRNATAIYVYVVLDTQHGEVAIAVDVDVDDIPEILKNEAKQKEFITKLIESIANEVQLNVSDIVALSRSTEIIEKLKEAYRFFKLKETGIAINELQHEVLPKQRVFLEKQLRTRIYKPLIFIYEPGKKPIIIGYNMSPSELDSLIKSIREGGYAISQKLEELGVNINLEKAQIYIKSIPYLLAYKYADYIVLSRKPLPRGEVFLRLRALPANELRRILDEIPEFERKMLVKEIAKELGVSLDKPKNGEDEIQIIQSFIENYGHRILLAETGLPRQVLDHYMGEWINIVKRIFDLADGDPLVKLFYKGMILEYSRAEYAPHTLIVTSTNAGKTLLYRSLVGKEPLSDVTPKTLVGHYSLEEKKVVRGLLHNQRLAIQIESLESKTARDVLKLLIDYMKSGVACRGVQKEICVQGSAPVILTANITRTGRALTLQNYMKLGLLDNPEALSSRLLVFYKVTKKLEIKDYKEFVRLCEFMRELRDSDIISRKLEEIWSLPAVEEWINTPDKLAIDLPFEEEVSDLTQYLEGLSVNFYPRLRALALNATLVDFLDKIYYMTMDEIREKLVSIILTKTEEIYEYLKLELAESIKTILEEYKIIDPTLEALNLQKPYRQLLVALHDYLNAKAINKDIVTLDLDEILNFMKLQGDKAYILKHRITRKYWSETVERVLSRLGVYMVFTENKVLVKVDTQVFSSLDFSKIQYSLSK